MSWTGEHDTLKSVTTVDLRGMCHADWFALVASLINSLQEGEGLTLVTDRDVTSVLKAYARGPRSRIAVVHTAKDWQGWKTRVENPSRPHSKLGTSGPGSGHEPLSA